MWQPNRPQWAVIWIVAILLIVAWPPREGRSIAVRAARWLADPRNELPLLPEPLPMGLGDDGDAVMEHDRRMQDYYAFYEGSDSNQLRLRLKTAEEPLDPALTRQLLTGVAVFAALGVWWLNGRQARA